MEHRTRQEGGIAMTVAGPTARAFVNEFGDGPLRIAEVFALAKRSIDMDLDQIEELLEHPDRRIRLGAVSVMDFQARRRSTTPERRRDLYELYLRRHDRIDDWSMVDRAAPWVVGGYLIDKPRDPLYELARSSHWWERRTAITATWPFIREGQLDDTFGIAELLIDDPEHFVQTAVGGWVREAGKRDVGRLRSFLDRYAGRMPRTTLRMAIEHLDADQRHHYRSITDRPHPSQDSDETEREPS
jgi:3-methyladenine DNA glycosylase AlkD